MSGVGTVDSIDRDVKRSTWLAVAAVVAVLLNAAAVWLAWFHGTYTYDDPECASIEDSIELVLCPPTAVRPLVLLAAAIIAIAGWVLLVHAVRRRVATGSRRA